MRQEPNVALVLASSTGGIGRHLASLVAGLTAAGHRVTLHGPAATESLFRFAELGAQFRAVEIPANPRPGDAAAVAALRRAWREDVPDVVHAHGLRAGLVASLARPPGAPLVVTWHNVVLAGGLRGRAYRLIERRVARAATVTLGASPDLVELARSLGARDVRFGPVAAPPLPLPARSPGQVRDDLGVEDGRPLVLSVGRLHPQKGYDILIAAAARWVSLPGPPFVVIAGAGPSYMSLAAQVSRQRAPVLLAGPRGDVPDLLAAADLAVVTSVWEARQLFAQEALRAGVPLVATAVGGLPELLGDAAILVPPGDVDALDQAARSVLADQELRADLAERGQRQAAGWPSEADTLAQVRAVYHELTDVMRDSRADVDSSDDLGSLDDSLGSRADPSRTTAREDR